MPADSVATFPAVTLSLPSSDIMAASRDTIIHWPRDTDGKPSTNLLGDVLHSDSIGHHTTGHLGEVQTIAFNALDTAYMLLFTDTSPY